MLSKEERAASRAICDAATEGPWDMDAQGTIRAGRKTVADLWTKICNGELWDGGIRYPNKADAIFIAHARIALPVALDSLNEMEILIEAERMKRPIEVTGEAATSAILAMELGEAEADRDYWKERAKTLELTMLEGH